MGMHSLPQQAGPKIQSPLNVRKTVATSCLQYSLFCGNNDNGNPFFSDVNNNGTNWSLVLFTVVKYQSGQYLCKFKKKFEMDK
jgi:hypothetical protein